jgi:hypothetical protein
VLVDQLSLAATDPVNVALELLDLVDFTLAAVSGGNLKIEQ